MFKTQSRLHFRRSLSPFREETETQSVRGRSVVSGLHNCFEFSQPLECLYQAIQTEGKSFLLLKYCFFQKNTVTLPFTSNLFVNVKFHSA